MGRKKQRKVLRCEGCNQLGHYGGKDCTRHADAQASASLAAAPVPAGPAHLAQAVPGHDAAASVQVPVVQADGIEGSPMQPHAVQDGADAVSAASAPLAQVQQSAVRF